MDDFERRCLRKKRHVFVEQVEITLELLEDMNAKGLISREHMEHILAEKHNNYKVGRLFEILLTSPLINAYDVLCAVLVKDYAWLSKELQTDSQCEKGNLTIDDDVMKEAGMLVHRKFGSSKRMSEVEKKDVQEMIAMKIQVSKDDWKKEMETLKEELDVEKHEVTSRDSRLRELDETLMYFLKKWEDQLTNRAHDMTTTTEFLRDVMENGDYVSKLSSKLKYLMNKIEKVFKERVTLVKERENIMGGMGVTDYNIKLDTLVCNKLEEYPFRIEKMKAELKDRDQTIDGLRKMLADVQSELDYKEQMLTEIAGGGYAQDDDVIEKEENEVVPRDYSATPGRKEGSNMSHPRQEVRNGRHTGHSRRDAFSRKANLQKSYSK